MMLLRKADAETGYFKAAIEATDDIIEQIASWNGNLTAKKVREHLEQGRRVYTAFSYFVRIS